MKVIFKPLTRDVKAPIEIDCEKRNRLTIGRKDGNDVILPFRNVSSFHAIIECVDGIVYLEDLNSTNGTFLNNSKITSRVPVKNGDRVRFASYEFVAEFERKEEEKIEQPEPAEGTVLVDSSMVDEVLAETQERVKEENVANKTVLYGVKGLIQNGRLVLLDEKGNFKEEFELDEIEISIGRDEKNNIAIDHPSISRIHCFINRKDDFYEIVDNDSTNGVFVNGKKVKKSILKNGDIVQLGDVEFVFIAPGELFSPMLLKRDSKKKSGFDRKKVYGTIFGIFLLLFIILALLPSGKNPRRKKISISLKELKLNVINSYKNEDWDNVVYLVENFNLKGFDKEYKKAKFEIKNRKVYLKLVDLLNENNFSEAKSLLNTIPVDSVYFQKGKNLLEEREEEYLNKKYEEIESLIDENKIVEAYNLSGELKNQFPENEKVKSLWEGLSKKYELFMKKKRARVQYIALRRRVNKESKKLVKEAEQLYLNGEIVDAIAKIIDAQQLYLAKNLRVPLRLKKLKENLARVRDLYMSGKKLVMQGKTEEAASKFEELFKISNKFLFKKEGKIENECKKLLKDYYIDRADYFYSQSNYAKALSYATKVLDIEPSNRRMLNLKREILRTAKDLYNKGYIEQTQYGNCKAALFYFKQVVEILPPDDPVYKKAVKRIKQCEK